MADYNNYNNAPQYGAAPQPQYGAAPVAPAAAPQNKQPIPTKIIAIAAAAVAAIILLIVIIGNGLPGKVEDEVKDYYEDMGVKVGSLKCEYKVSKSGAKCYIISGRIKEVDIPEDEINEYNKETMQKLEDCEDGYFIGVAYAYKDEVMYFNAGRYEKDEKDDFKEELKDGIKEMKEEKADVKEELEDYKDMVKEDD